jgi:hypothetical protein
MAGQGKAADLRPGALGGCVRAPRCSLVAGQAPGYGHPFGFPRLPTAGGMGRSACGQRDQSKAPPRWVTGPTLRYGFGH